MTQVSGVMLRPNKQVGNGKTHVRQMVLSPGLVEALRGVQEGCARAAGHDLVEFPAEERRSLPSGRERCPEFVQQNYRKQKVVKTKMSQTVSNMRRRTCGQASWLRSAKPSTWRWRRLQ